MSWTDAPTAKTAFRPWQAGLLGFVLLALAPQVSGAAQDDAARLFGTLDMNADKQIDRDEFNIQEMEIFYNSDANRDGFLALEETILSPASFATVDHDKDGKVTGFEFIDAKLTDFDAIDRDGNGILTADEFAAFLATIKKPD